MSNHTAAGDACQPPQDSTAPKTPPLHSDRRLVARYGTDALDAGYVAIPRVVIRRRHALGITAAEWDYICEVWSYWCSERLPGPSVEDLARGLSVDQSTIRRHRANLERKGLIRIVPAGPYNRYDLRPLIDAAVGIDRMRDNLDYPDPAANTHADDVPPAPGPCSSPTDDRAELHATKEVEKKLVYDSIPPYPPLHGNARFRTEVGSSVSLSQPEDADDQTLAAAIGALSVELGDDTPVSSVTRARNLRGNADASLDRFLKFLNEAAARTRDRQASIVKRRRGDDQTPNGLPYMLAILQDLLRPAPARAPDLGPDLGRRRTDRLGRRRRRDEPAYEACDAHTSSYGHYPDPPPDTIPVPWRATLEELRSELTADNYRRWFVPTRVLTQDGDLLRIAVDNSFDQRWLDRRLRGAIERAMGRVAPGWRVEFVVDVAA